MVTEVLLAYYIGLAVFALNGLMFMGMRSQEAARKAEVRRLYRLVMGKRGR